MNLLVQTLSTISGMVADLKAAKCYGMLVVELYNTDVEVSALGED